jgi:hypothetical protein
MPTKRGVTVETSSTGKLEKRNPIDVVVAPIENESKNEAAPLADLRAAFQHGLVKARYSPLSLELVDSKVVDDVYKPGALQEDADLVVKIERWDTSLWDTHSALLIKAEVRMIDPKEPAGGVLWTGKIDHRYEFGAYRNKYNTDAAMSHFVCEEIASEILAALPPRTTAPGSLAPAR